MNHHGGTTFRNPTCLHVDLLTGPLGGGCSP